MILVVVRKSFGRLDNDKLFKTFCYNGFTVLMRLLKRSKRAMLLPNHSSCPSKELPSSNIHQNPGPLGPRDCHRPRQERIIFCHDSSTNHPPPHHHRHHRRRRHPPHRFRPLRKQEILTKNFLRSSTPPRYHLVTATVILNANPRTIIGRVTNKERMLPIIGRSLD